MNYCTVIKCLPYYNHRNLVTNKSKAVCNFTFNLFLENLSKQYNVVYQPIPYYNFVISIELYNNIIK